jgi:hypothetical protein
MRKSTLKNFDFDIANPGRRFGHGTKKDPANIGGEAGSEWA